MLDPQFVLILVVVAVLSAGAAVVLYYITRAAVEDGTNKILDERGLGRKPK